MRAYLMGAAHSARRRTMLASELKGAHIGCIWLAMRQSLGPVIGRFLVAYTVGAVQMPADLTATELDVQSAALNGEVVELRSRTSKARVVRAGVIYQLCVSTPQVHAKGVRLAGAVIEGALDFGAATLKVPLILKSCLIVPSERSSWRAVNLEQACGSWISFEDCHLQGAFSAVQLRLTTSLSLLGSTVSGFVDLTGADITGTVVMDSARILGTNDDANAFIGDGLKIGGSMLVRGARFGGAVRLPVSEVNRTLEMDGSELNGSDDDGDALIADGLTVRGNLLLRDGFTSMGCLRFPGADVSGTVVLGAAEVTRAAKNGEAWTASRARFGRVVFQEKVSFAGSVSFAEARIDGRLDLAGATRIPTLVLKGARCSEFADSDASWPPVGQLRAVGFQFDRVDDVTGWAQRLVWVRRQGFTDWSPDPYEQVASFYARTGDESAARAIRIAKNDDELKHLKDTKKVGTLRYRFWRRPFGWLLGYGYRRWVAGWLLVAVVVVSAFGFWRLDQVGAMTPNVSQEVAKLSCGAAYPCFNAPVYGADVVLPIVDLGQEDTWRPNARASWGWAAESLRWFAIATGWLLASIFVAAFTNLIRKD